MNFKIAFVGAALMAFGGIFTVGCGGSDCDTALDTVSAKYDTCGATLPTGGTTEGGECTEAAGKLLLCTAACTDQADCSIIKPDAAKPPTEEQSKAYSACNTACLTAK